MLLQEPLEEILTLEEVLNKLSKCNYDLDVFYLGEMISNSDEINEQLCVLILDEKSKFIIYEKEYLSVVDYIDNNNDNDNRNNLFYSISSDYGYTMIMEFDEQKRLCLTLHLERQTNCSLTLMNEEIFTSLMTLRDLLKKNKLIKENLSILKNKYDLNNCLNKFKRIIQYIYCLTLAQLAERWTVIVLLWLSTGRWFDSSK